MSIDDEKRAAARAAAMLVGDGMRTRDAARDVASRHGASANDLYRAAIEDPS